MIWIPVLLALAYGLPLLAFSGGHLRLMQSRSSIRPDERKGVGASTNSEAASLRVSVVIAARNEAENIGACLASVLNQTVSAEIIVVDDGSEDATAAIIDAAGPGVRRMALASGQGKKAAVEAGVEAATGDIILLTDADCTVPPRWVEQMRGSFDRGTGFVAGPVAFEPGPRFFDRIVELEWAGLMGIAAGAIGFGVPISCSGANMAYRKDVFHEVNGYANLSEFHAGDDELLMQHIADKTNWKVRFCASREAVVTTRPPRTVPALLNQRRRWASMGTHYERHWLKAMSVGFWLYFCSIPVAGLGAVWIEALRMPFLIGLGIKVGSEVLLLSQSTAFYGRFSLMRYYLAAFPFQIGYVIWAGAAGMRGNYVWKSRQLKR